jgi:hypothetical protein
MPTCGDIDGKGTACEWWGSVLCHGMQTDDGVCAACGVERHRQAPVCQPVADLLECRRDRDLYDRMGSFSYRSALEWKERAEKAQARIAELEKFITNEDEQSGAELDSIKAERDRLREWAAAQPCDSVRLYGGLPIPPEYAKVTCGKCIPCQARAVLRDGGDDDQA